MIKKEQCPNCESYNTFSDIQQKRLLRIKICAALTPPFTVRIANGGGCIDMKKTLWLILLLGLSSCIIKGNKNKHLSTVKIHEVKGSQGRIVLYVERFSDLGKGLPGSDLTYDYLTDSLTFRLYMGKYDDVSEMLTANIKGDRVTVLKSTTEGQSVQWQNPKVLETREYSLKELKKMGVFE